MNLSKETLSYIAAFVTVLVWSSSFTGISIALESFNPEHLALLRFLIASFCLGVLSFFRPLPKIKKRDWPLIIVLSIVGLTGYHLFLNFGQRSLPAATTSFIVSSIPIWVALISFLFKKEQLGIKSWFAILLSFAGVVITIASKSREFHFEFAAVLVLLAAICTAIRYVFQIPLLARYGSLSLSIISIWIATLPMLYFSSDLIPSLRQASNSSILATLYIGTFPIFVYSIWSFATLHISATLVASFLNIIPILATIIAWLILGELPPSMTFVGGFIAILGIFILHFSKPKTLIKEKIDSERIY